MKLSGEYFTNSATCHGKSFVAAGAQLDLAEIVIRGRYPETGWAMNDEIHEMVRIMRGIGSLCLRGQENIALSDNDVVHVPPKTQFAWEGDMTLWMACSPAFNSEQYEVREDES